MEIFVVSIVDPVSGSSIFLRIPSGSFEVIARWFINDFNHFEIKIVDRYTSKPDGSPIGETNEHVSNADFMHKYGICLNKGKDGSNNL